MIRVEYAILGAGPSGVSLAHALLDRGVKADKILVIEKESVAGGLCRSLQVNGAPVDIGGGHFLDVRKKKILDFLFRFLPETEWATFYRISKIRLHGGEVDHPLEANLWQLPKKHQREYLDSIARAGCVRGDPMPESFENWVVWKFGDHIARQYMLPYNRKIWSMDLNELGTYWLNKLPNVSYRETLRSCLEKRSLGSLPAHGVFLYPKRYGYGEVWRRMGDSLGKSLIASCPIECIDLATRTVNRRWSADRIINTVPWTLWPGFCAIPDYVEAAIRELRSVSIDVDFIPGKLNSPAHWIYDPDETVAHHRLLLRTNFCTAADGYWTETNACRSAPSQGWRYHNEFSYPVNTISKPSVIKIISQWALKRGVESLGRWGTWEHLNSDVAVEEALAMAEKLTK